VRVTETSLPRPSAPVQHDDHAFAAWAATVAGERLTEVRGEGLQGRALKDAGDLAAHDLLMALCAQYRPGDAVLSEEGKDDKVRLTADRVWIIDPLDGTREFSEPPRDDWAVHVALWERGELVAGAVAQPGLGATFHTGEPPSGRGSRSAAPARRLSSRASPRIWTPSWCRWAPQAPRSSRWCAT
jgi:3'(2'), 5'-bisphosphate nucleotidase